MTKFNSKFLLSATLLPALLANLAVSRADDKVRPPRIYLLGLKKPIEKPIKIGAPGEVGFLRDAIYFARNAQSSDGATPAIYATISIVSLEQNSSLGGKFPDRTKVWYSYGQLQPSSGTESLEGKLRLWSNSGEGSNPFPSGGNMTLGVVIKQNGRTSFHFQVDGRNRMGKGPEEFQPDTDQEMLLTTTRDFFGQKSLITISLTRSWSGKVATADKKQAIGARYRVTPRFVVTKQNDGPGDSNLEVRGKISFTHYKNKTQKDVNLEVPLSEDMKSGYGAMIVDPFKPFNVEVRFDTDKTKRLLIVGEVHDTDDWSDNDQIWVRGYSAIDLQKTVDKGGKETLKGDDDDDSGDLVIEVEKISDIF